MPLLGRWAAFNVVGLMGVAVQLTAFSLLVRWAGLDYLPATAISVEAAILHNFVWHQRWTWRDRPVATIHHTINRLARFHVANGAISLAGNLAVMATLAGALSVDPILANAAAIATCSLINFVAGTTFVFRAGPGGCVPGAGLPRRLVD